MCVAIHLYTYIILNNYFAIATFFFQFADSDGSWWIEELNLKSDDYYCLCNGFHISERVVNASQQLMRQQFKVGGLQNTLLGQNPT